MWAIAPKDDNREHQLHPVQEMSELEGQDRRGLQTGPRSVPIVIAMTQHTDLFSRIQAAVAQQKGQAKPATPGLVAATIAGPAAGAGPGILWSNTIHNAWMTMVEAFHRKRLAGEFKPTTPGISADKVMQNALSRLYPTLPKEFKELADKWEFKGKTDDRKGVWEWVCPLCQFTSTGIKCKNNARRHLATASCWLDRKTLERLKVPKQPVGGRWG
jgi:hypothetical protein